MVRRSDRRASALAVILVAALLLPACAGDGRSGSDWPRTPAEVAAEGEHPQGRSVEWGGVLVEARNLQDRTELEILAHPLLPDGRPQPDRRPQGRFIAVRPGYLETADYRPGRLVTVTGTLLGIRDGRVGDAAYRFPEVEIRRSVLWPDGGLQGGPRVNFGVGAGNRGGGVGIRIGF